MNRFFIYKEYGAKYEMMIKDIAFVQRAMPALETHQKGIEILASSLGSERSCTEYAKKRALSIGDLLMKVSTASTSGCFIDGCRRSSSLTAPSRSRGYAGTPYYLRSS